tara:strand:- start:1379 stop:5917 length:4539 start_codon:yes stop_codon:yes gene_type:complete
MATSFLDPSKHDDIFKEASEKYGVPFEILKSIAYKESSYDTDAEGDLNLANTPLGSSAGLFQFRYGTGVDVGLVDPKTGKDDRKDPRKASFAAAKMLKDNQDYFKGNLRLAIEAHNTGRGNAGKSNQGKQYATSVFKFATEPELVKAYSNYDPKKIEVAQVKEEEEVDPKIKEWFYKNKERLEKEEKEIQPKEPTLQDTKLDLTDKPEFYKDIPVKDMPRIDPNKVEDIQLVVNKHTLGPKPVTEEQARDLTSDTNFNIMRNYLIRRLGIKDNPFLSLEFINKEATRDQVKDLFLSHMRKTEFNTTFGGVPELSYLYQASNEDVLVAAKAHELYDAIPNFYDKDSFIEGVDSFFTGIGRMFTDPTAYIGLGVGTFFKYKLARQGIKEALKLRLKEAVKEKGLKKGEKLAKEEVLKIRKEVVKERVGQKKKAILYGGAAEAAVGVGMESIAQDIDIKLKRTTGLIDLANAKEKNIITKEEFEEAKADLILNTQKDKEMLGFAALVSGVFGMVGAGQQAVGLKNLVNRKFITKEDQVGALTKYKMQLAEKRKTMDDIVTDVDFDRAAKAYTTLINQTDFNNTKFALTKDQVKLFDSKIIKEKFEKGFFTIDKPTTLTELKQIDKDIKIDEGLVETLKVKDADIKKAMAVSFEVLTNDVERFRIPLSQFLNGEKKVSSVLKEVASEVAEGNIDSNILASALGRAGIDESDLAKMGMVNPTELADGFNNLNFVAKGLRKAITLDPELQKVYDLKYVNMERDKTSSFVGAGLHFIKRMERESKALVVSSIGTTIRNIYGTTIGVSLDTAARVLDAGIFTGGKIISSAIDGRYNDVGYVKGFGGDMADFFDESMQTFANFYNQSLFTAPFNQQARTKIANQFDLVLSHDHVQRNLLLTSMQETGTHSLSRFSRFVNGFNLAQDAFFRRGTFVNSVRRQLKQNGLNLEDLLAQGRKVPIGIIQNATDEALEGTFSKVPKVTGVKKAQDAFSSVEDTGNFLGKQFINIFETIPFSTLAVTFPRFMVNSLAFQYRYSIFQFGKAGQEAFNGFAEATFRKKQLIKQLENNVELERRTKLPRTDPDALTEFQMIKHPDWTGEKGGTNDIKRALRMQDQKVAEAYRASSLALARGAVGTSMLYAAYKYRETFGEDTAGEYYNLKLPGGGTMDTRAIFPIAPFLAISDFLYKYNTKQKLPETIEIAKAVTGMKLQGGAISNFPLLDELANMTKEDLLNSDKVFKVIGDGVANLLGRAFQPFQPIVAYGDMISSDSENLAAAKDPKVVDSTGVAVVAERAYKRLLLRVGGTTSETFFDIADTVTFGVPSKIKEAIQQIAPFELVSKGDLPKNLRKFDYGPNSRPGEFFNLLKGFREVPRINEVEREFRNLDVNIWSTYQFSGDEKFDRLLIEKSLNYMVGTGNFMNNVIQDRNYRKLDKGQRALILKTHLSKLISYCRKEAMADISNGDEEKFKQFAKLQFNKFDKDIANEMIKQFNRFEPKPFNKNDSRDIIKIFEYESRIYDVN